MVNKFKIRTLIITFIAIISAVVIIATIFINIFLNSYLKNQISKQVYKSSGGLYSIKMEDLNSNFWTGTVYIEKLLIYQDSSQIKTMHAESPDQNTSTVKLYIPSLEIHHIRWINYLINKNLKVGKILVESPEMIVHGSTVSESIQKNNKKFIELLPAFIADFAGSLKIEEMNISSGKFNYDLETDKELIIQTGEEIFIDLNEILIDTIPSKKVLYSEDIQISFSNYRLKTSTKLHTLSIDKISGILSDSTLQIENFHYSKKDTINKGDKAAEILIKRLKGDRVSFRDFFYNKKIFIGKLLMESPKIVSTIHQENNKKNESADKSRERKNKFFISPIIAGIIKGFTINELQVDNGLFRNKIYNPQNIIFQKADNLNLHILKVAGVIVDSILFQKPAHISARFYNYEFKLNTPATNVNIKEVKVSSLDSVIRLDKSNLSYRDERVKSNRIYLNNFTDQILAKGFDLHAYLDHNKINFTKILFTNPNTDLKIIKEKSSQRKPYTTNITFSNLIKSFKVDRIDIKNGNFINETSISGDTITHQSKSYNLTIKGILPSSGKTLPNLTDIDGEFKDYELRLGKQKFVLNAESANISSKMSTASIKNLKINQYHPKIQDNIFNTTITDFRINQFDFKRAINKSEVVAGSISLNDMHMNFYLKEGKTIKPDYAKKMPNEMAKSIPFYFRINKFNITNCLLTCIEKENSVVLYTLNNTQATVYNLTNDKKLMTIQNPAKLFAETMIMKQGKFHLNISVPLLSPQFDCSYKGRIESMNGEAFNKIFISYADIESTSGRIDSGSFHVNVSNGIAKGNMKLVYHDFHVRALNKEGKIKKFSSIKWNFIIKNGNPNHRNEEPEVIEIKGERNADDGIFSFLWRPIKEGIIKTVTKDTFVQ